MEGLTKKGVGGGHTSSRFGRKSDVSSRRTSVGTSEKERIGSCSLNQLGAPRWRSIRLRLCVCVCGMGDQTSVLVM